MCGIPSIFVTLNISTFCSKALVATFPTELDSSRLELPYKSYCGSPFLVLQFLLSPVVPTLARYYRVIPCGTTAGSTGPSTASPDGSLPLEVLTR